MKYLSFSKSHPVEDINGGYVISDNGEAMAVPFEVFFKGIIMGDDRWGKNVKTLTMLMDVRDKIKSLSYNDANDNKVLELTDDEWTLACEIVETPQAGFNVQLATALFSHIKDLKEASSLPLKLD
jgi:hypothetical protein